MLLTVVIIVVVILIVGVAGLLGFAASKPNAFRIQRAASIKAPPERIFPLINDFHNWASWSPWEKLDPALKRTYSGAASGPGAIYEWEGNKNRHHFTTRKRGAAGLASGSRVPVRDELTCVLFRVSAAVHEHFIDPPLEVFPSSVLALVNKVACWIPFVRKVSMETSKRSLSVLFCFRISKFIFLELIRW